MPILNSEEEALVNETTEISINEECTEKSFSRATAFYAIHSREYEILLTSLRFFGRKETLIEREEITSRAYSRSLESKSSGMS